MRLSFAGSLRRTPQLTPRQRYDQAAKDVDYSNRACLGSCAFRTVVLTGVEAGQDKQWVPGERTPRGFSWKKLFSRKAVSDDDEAQAEMLKASYVDRDGEKPAFASLGVTWVEQGLWQGRKAHFLRLHIEHHSRQDQWVERVELDIRVWKAGDAIKSIAPLSNRPLSSVHPPPALELAAAAPEIVLYGPRAVVGRAAGTPVDCYWDGHFQPGDNWVYFAEARTPQHLALIHPTHDNVWSMLRVLAYGDYALKQPAPSFDIGLVILSDGKPFDLTAYSTTYHQDGGNETEQHLWSPYSPVKINGTMRLIPEGGKPIGPLNLGSRETKVKWKDLIDWSKPYDTVCSPSMTPICRLTGRYGSATGMVASITRARRLAVVGRRVAEAALRAVQHRLARSAILRCLPSS